MPTQESFVTFIQAQSGLGAALSFKKMFGEYALCLDGKTVALACDNQLYLKPTDAGRALLGTVAEHPPYPGAKRYFRIDEQLDDGGMLRVVLETTARALPMAKPKAASKENAEGKVQPTPKRKKLANNAPNRKAGRPVSKQG